MRKTLTAIFVVLALMTAGARAQVRYGGYLSFEYVKGATDSGFSTASFRNIDAGVMAGGVIGGKFGFGLEIRSRDVSRFDLEQAWVGLLASNAFNVRAGMYLVPFGLWNRTNRPYETPVIRTPLNIAYLYPENWRDLGLTVEGQVSIFAYAAYLGNGLGEGGDLMSGQQFTDNNKDKGKGGRLGLVFTEGLQAGVSYYSGAYDEAGALNLALEGADFSWVTAQWEVRAEFTKALLDNPEPYAEAKSEGFYVWAVMSFAHFQPVGGYQRVKYIDPNPLHTLDPELPGGIALKERRWHLGLRYVLTENIFLKFEYDWNKDLLHPELKLNQYQFQAALGF